MTSSPRPPPAAAPPGPSPPERDPDRDRDRDRDRDADAARAQLTEPQPDPAPASPPSDTSASTASPASAAALHLSPLPPTPPRTSSSVSSSRPSDLLPGVTRRHFAHGVTALLALSTTPCAAPPSPREKHSLYYGIHPPTISTKDYVDRLLTHAHCSPSAFIVALVNLRRVARREPNLRLCPENLHRLVITALVIAVKLVDDRVFSMRHYARVGGVPSPAELARLERQFLVFADSRIFVRRKAFLRTLDVVCALRDHPRGSAAAAKAETAAAAAAAAAPHSLATESPARPAASTTSTATATATTAACTASSAPTAQHASHAVEKGVSDTGPAHAERRPGGPGGPGGPDRSTAAGAAGSAAGSCGKSGKPGARARGGGSDGDGDGDGAADTSGTDQRTPERRAAAPSARSTDADELLTVQTAAAEVGKPPVFGARRAARAIERRAADAGVVPPAELSLGPSTTVEDDSGVLDDSDDDDDVERGLDDFELDCDDDDDDKP